MAQASGDRLLYNFPVKSWDVIIVGGGIIGLSLAISLRKQALRVLVVERSEPGREASSAAAGMLVGCGTEIPEVLKVLAAASAEMYPEFVHELEDESGLKVDLRDQGTIVISRDGKFPERVESLSSAQLSELEPELAIPHGGSLARRAKCRLRCSKSAQWIRESWLRQRSRHPGIAAWIFPPVVK